MVATRKTQETIRRTKTYETIDEFRQIQIKNTGNTNATKHALGNTQPKQTTTKKTTKHPGTPETNSRFDG